MKLLARSRRRAADDEPDFDVDPAAGSEGDGETGESQHLRLQSRWTGGPVLAARVATVLLWSALLAGPAALLLTGLGAVGGGPRVVAAPAVTGPDPGEQAAVGEFAQRLVVVWLQTPSGGEEALAPLVQGSSLQGLQLPQVPWRADQPATAGLRRAGPGVWSVTVGVTVAPLRAPAGAGFRRYFQVPVDYTRGSIIAWTLPAPVSAPPAGAEVSLGYPFPAPPAGPLSTAVQGFLTALLTGSGDVTRYVSPGSSIPAVLPVPYRVVTVASVMADRELPGGSAAPAGGERVRVLITAVAAAGRSQQLSVQYALALTARAGRWEVTALDPAPELAAAPATSPSAGASSPPSTTGPAGVSGAGEQPAIN